MDLVRDIIEVLVMATAIYLILRFLRETRGSGVVRGLAIFLISLAIFAFVIVPLLNLSELQYVFQELLQTAVLALLIVFQPEIRQAIIRLGESPIFKTFRTPGEEKVIQRMLRALARLSSENVGALIVFQRESPLKDVVERGIKLDALVNSFLLEAIFYPGNPLHDGAVVIEGDRILAASCLLPLSQNQDISKRLGSRHRAALGITEETDALSLVVSEETGRISAALGGRLLQDLKLSEVEKVLEEFYGVKEA